MGKIAIFGGTFDPVHWGHLLIADSAMHQAALDRVIWFPDRCSPHKLQSAIASFEHRCEMIRQAIADRPEFALLPGDITPIQTSYAWETLRSLQPLCPETRWHWIIGLDAFQTLPKWRCSLELVPLCDWLVAPRPCWTPTQSAIPLESICEGVAQHFRDRGVPLHWQLLEMPAVGLSSSLIRQYSQQGRSLRYLVPESVQTYLTVHKLYAP